MPRRRTLLCRLLSSHSYPMSYCMHKLSALFKACPQPADHRIRVKSGGSRVWNRNGIFAPQPRQHPCWRSLTSGTSAALATCHALASAALPVHPHMRGDNGLLLYTARGSTVHPHMRGDNFGDFRRLLFTGGSPPHAWGQFARGSLRGSACGSPPHAWGQCFMPSLRCSGIRFTPTCVGTMYSLAADVRYRGSPPHAWGQ